LTPSNIKDNEGLPAVLCLLNPVAVQGYRLDIHPHFMPADIDLFAKRHGRQNQPAAFRGNPDIPDPQQQTTSSMGL
jgi:hypothetical protein